MPVDERADPASFVVTINGILVWSCKECRLIFKRFKYGIYSDFNAWHTSDYSITIIVFREQYLVIFAHFNSNCFFKQFSLLKSKLFTLRIEHSKLKRNKLNVSFNYWFQKPRYDWWNIQYSWELNSKSHCSLW